jgi:uncharacterized protein YbjT (DUF2867 family)
MILVTGATGKVGAEVVRALRAAKAPFRAGLRSPGKAQGYEAVPFDLDRPETFGPALSGIDELFLLSSGGTEREIPVVEAAKKAGIKHVVKLSVWNAQTDAFAFARHHRSVEKRIEASGLPWTFLRPNGYMQNLSTSLAPVIRAKGTFYFPFDFSHSIVDTRDLGAVAATILTEADRHRSQAYPLSGPENLSNAQIAEKLSAATGKTIRFVEIPEAAFRGALLESGLPAPYADDYLDLLRYYRTGGGEGVTPDVAKLTGRPATSFDQFARDQAAAWK